MCSGVSPCMLTAASEQPAFNTSSAISTLPAYAAQWRHTFISWRETQDWSKNLKFIHTHTHGGRSGSSPRCEEETDFINNGDIGSSVQQRFDHVNVFVLRSPDDRRPTATVLNRSSQGELRHCDAPPVRHCAYMMKMTFGSSFTCAFTSTCPVSRSIVTISRFPSLAAWWRPVYPSSSWRPRTKRLKCESTTPLPAFVVTLANDRHSQHDRHRRHSGPGSEPPLCDCWWWLPTEGSSGLCPGRPL